MWIPYDIRASLKAESDAATVRMSRADESERDFLVGFFLRNPVTQVWELDLVASPQGLEISAAPGLPGATITYHGNDAGKLTEVIYRLAATSATEALARAHDDFQRRLLRYMSAIGRGMAIAGWRIADSKHGARWRCTPFRPSAMNLDFETLAPIARDLAPFVELFQRARNAPDAVSRLMAAFAVLHAAQSRHPALSGAVAPDFTVTQEMLVHAMAMEFAPQFQGLDLSGLIAALEPEHQRLVAPGGLLAALSDDLPAQQRLSQFANLADHVAHRLIAAELRSRSAAATLPAGRADGAPAFAEGGRSC